MKRIWIILLYILTFGLHCEARKDVWAANNLESLNAYFEKNLSDLDPVEGVYDITLLARVPKEHRGTQMQYKIFIEEVKGNEAMVASFLGLNDPFNWINFTEEEKAQTHRLIPHALIEKTTAPYVYFFGMLMPSQEIDSKRFQVIGLLKLDPNTYNFEIEISYCSPLGVQYLRLPEHVYKINGDEVVSEIKLKGERLSCTPSPAPLSNIGQTLVEMQVEFPDMKLLGKDNTGTVYQSGHVSEGIYQLFSFDEDALVIEESLFCESRDSFAWDFYMKMRNSFAAKYETSIIRESQNEIKFVFPYYTLTITFSKEGGWGSTKVWYKRL